MQRGRWTSPKICYSALYMDCTKCVIQPLSKAKSSLTESSDHPELSLATFWEQEDQLSARLCRYLIGSGYILRFHLPIVTESLWDFREIVLSTAYHRAKCSTHNAESVSRCSQHLEPLYTLWASGEELAMTAQTPGSCCPTGTTEESQLSRHTMCLLSNYFPSPSVRLPSEPDGFTMMP